MHLKTSSKYEAKSDKTTKRVNKSTAIVGDFKTLLLEMDRLSNQNISKDIFKLNSTSNQLDIIDIYGLVHPNTEKHTFFWSFHGILSNIDHIQDHQKHHHKCKIIEVIIYPPSGNNGVTLDVNNRKVAGKSQNIWRSNNTFLSNTCVKKDSPEKLKPFWTKWKCKHNLTFVGYSKSCA